MMCPIRGAVEWRRRFVEREGMARRRQWRDLSPAQQIATVIAGAVQLALFGAAELDLWRRPAYEVRGRKWVWSALAFLNFVGPLAYFAFGRRR